MNRDGNARFMRTANNYISEAVRKRLGAHAFPSNTIVFAKVGAAIFLERKKLLTEPSCLDNNMAGFTLQSAEADLLFLYFAFQTIRLGDLVNTTALPALNSGVLGRISIPLPPRPEQEAIAEALSDADALIESLEQLITKKRLIKQGAMQELLTGKRRLPGFEGEWAPTTLGQLGTTYGGLTGKTKADFGSGVARYIPFLNVVTNTIIDAEDIEAVRVGPGENQNRAAVGDLFFNGSSETPDEVGLCAVLREHRSGSDLYLNSFCFGFRPSPDADLDGLYLAYFFRGPPGRDLMKSLAQGSTRYNLSKRALLEAEFQFPKSDEQSAIAHVLYDMDAEIDALGTKLDKARMVKQGMMHNLLTGRIRLV